MNNKIYIMNAKDDDNECWAKPSSIYSWKYGSAWRHATLAALPTPTSKMLERVVYVTAETWLARARSRASAATWAEARGRALWELHRSVCVRALHALAW